MKKLSLMCAIFGVAILSAATAWGQGTNPVQTNATATSAATPATPATTGATSNIDGLKPFSTLSAEGKIEIFVTVDPAHPQTMTIEFNGNDQNKFKWWDNEGKLELKFASSAKDRPIVVRLTCARLSSVDLSGASMTTVVPWRAKMMTVEMSAGAKLIATIETTDIELNATTKSVAVIDGLTTYAAFDARARSVVDASNLDAKSATLRANGYAECRIHGSERIVVDAFDGASIFWRGGPEILRLSHSRGATINPIGE